MPVFGAYSRYYDLLYRDKDHAAEAAHVRDLIRGHRPGARSVLDLGCGTGRHAALLAEMGYEVTGVDLSQEMLAAARAGSPLPDFRQGDIRTVRLGRAFDAVIALFHVMSYQSADDDLRAALATARDHLGPGGVFVFDVWYGPAVLTVRPEVRVKRLEGDGISVTRIAEPVMHPNGNLVDVNYTVLVRDRKSGALEELRETHRMRYLFRPEVELLLQEAGMSLLGAGEWMTGREPGFDTWGVCFVATKQGEGDRSA